MLPMNEENIARGAILRSELKSLTEETVEMNLYRSYFEGDQPLVYTTDTFDAVFGDTFAGFKDNWMKVIINAVRNRLKVVGFHFGFEDDDEDYSELQRDVWRQFMLNKIDVQQNDHHEGTLVEGRAFIIVWPRQEGGVYIDWQPGQLCRVFYDPDRRDLARWAVRRWSGETGDVYVTFYTPEAIYKFIDRNGDLSKAEEPSSASALTEIPGVGYFGGQLEERRVAGEPWPLPNPYGRVPVIEFNNTSYESELSDHISQQDALNKTLLDMMVTSQFAAYPQRAVETLSSQPEGGWVAGPGEVWHFKPSFDSDGNIIPSQFHEFSVADPSSYIKPIEMWLQHMALTSSTPVRYFMQGDRGGRGDAPSGDSLLVDDKPLNDKVEEKQERYGASWMEVAQLVAFSLGYEEAFSLVGETTWRDPRHDHRLSKLQEGKVMSETGLPIKFIAKHLGFSPKDTKDLLDSIEEAEAEAERKEAERFAMSAAQNESNSSETDSESDDS